VSARVHAIPDVEIAYDFAWQVNRVFGDSKSMRTHFARASHRPGPTGVTLFLYYADFDRAADAGLSRVTTGARIDGQPKVGDWTVRYDLAYAEQAEVGDNPADVEAAFLRLEAGAAARAADTPVRVRAGYERLGGNPTDGQFQTPFATLHAFNGWADKFLSTPVDGLVDLYGGVGATPGPFDVEVVYHGFKADDGDADYGTELDAQVTYKAWWGQVFAVKLATYDADTFSTDARKLWFWTQYAVR